jgi:hypothetical protein
VYYKDSINGYSVARGLYESVVGRDVMNNFTLLSSGTGCGFGTNTAYRKDINFNTDFQIDLASPTPDRLIMMRFRPLYAGTQIAVDSSSATLPLQGNTYESCGTTGTGIRRCISVAQNYRTPSGLFDYVVYSNTGSFAPVQ